MFKAASTTARAAEGVPATVMLRDDIALSGKERLALLGSLGEKQGRCLLVGATQVTELAGGIVTDNKIAPHAQRSDERHQSRPWNIQCFAGRVGHLNPSLVTGIKELHLLSSQDQIKIGLPQWGRRCHGPIISNI